MIIYYNLVNFVDIFTERLLYSKVYMTQSEVDFFDMLAPTWDANEVRSTPGRIMTILGRLPIKEGSRVLDLGTGTGVLVSYLSEMVGDEGHVTAIDLSEGMLSRAIKKYGDLGNVEFLKIDFEEEQIPGIYDVAMLYSVYPHLHAPADTIQWLFSMNIAPEGCIVIAFPCDEVFINNIHHERKSESDHLPPAHALARMIESWGYRAEVVAASKDEYVVVVRRGE